MDVPVYPVWMWSKKRGREGKWGERKRGHRQRRLGSRSRRQWAWERGGKAGRGGGGEEGWRGLKGAEGRGKGVRWGGGGGEKGAGVKCL